MVELTVKIADGKAQWEYSFASWDPSGATLYITAFPKTGFITHKWDFSSRAEAEEMIEPCKNMFILMYQEHLYDERGQ